MMLDGISMIIRKLCDSNASHFKWYKPFLNISANKNTYFHNEQRMHL